ncbi:M23 family metallopeptidase [Sphingomonas abietis]|uniref:M23 family metallopeptidase n=1 Tax=Sphingomonas abietis TaxID=3012344 RepID=A0ABY7NQ18_9SPHN|nr:M23 family metallopeptidase [Sphingomonas abietis]WBO23634.1 M23 family metallopeptidase [Sphingomonas abietis]
MSRFGIIVALVLLAGLIAFASVVHVTGPGWSGAGGGSTTGPRIVRAEAPSSLVIPVQGVERAALRDNWAEPRGGGARVHHAIDIMAPTGTPVLAAADGIIGKLFQSRLGGTTIYERSIDGGTVYYYAHLDHYAPTLVEGQTVKAGQEIGAVGSTGDADPAAPHLHFEIHRMAPGEGWWQGQEVNPYPILAGK